MRHLTEIRPPVWRWSWGLCLFASFTVTHYVAAGDGQAVRWPAGGRWLVRNTGEPDQAIPVLALSSTGRLLATRASDWAVHIWDLEQNGQPLKLSTNEHRFDRLLFSPDERVLIQSAAVTSDLTLVSEVRSGATVQQFPEGCQLLQAVDDGRLLGVADHRWLELSLTAGSVMRQTDLKGLHHAVPVALTHQGDEVILLIPQLEDQQIQVVNYRVATGHAELWGVIEAVDLTLTTDPRMNATRRWHVAGATESQIGNVAVPGDGGWLAVALPGTMQAHLVTRTGEASLLSGSRWPVTALCATPDGSYLVAAEDHCLRFWDMIHRDPSATVELPDCQVLSLTVSGDGRSLAAGLGGSSEGAVVWNFAELLWEAWKPIAPPLASAEEAWEAMTGANAPAATAYLMVHPQEAMPLLHRELHARLKEFSATEIQQLVSQLDANDFYTRSEAFRTLDSQKFQVRDALLRAWDQRLSLETRLSLARLLQTNRDEKRLASPDDNRMLRVITLLSHIGTDQSGLLLDMLATRHRSERIRIAAKAARQRRREFRED